MSHLRYPPAKPVEPEKPEFSLLFIDSETVSKDHPHEIPAGATHFTWQAYFNHYDEEVRLAFSKRIEVTAEDLKKYHNQLDSYKKDLEEYEEEYKIWQETIKNSKSQQEKKERELLAKLQKKYGTV